MLEQEIWEIWHKAWNDTLRSFHFILTILGLDAKE